jgi:protein phosphatase
VRQLLTIGAFARAVRLSPKALRHYDELGLLQPAVVDADSGYRYYDPGQVEQARLIPWLRRVGMPLARIRRVCELPAAQAAEEIAGFWRQVQAETAARGQLATFLVDYLTGSGSSVDAAPAVLGIRYAARSESGLLRTSNEDTAYAGPRLLAVADGVRGAAGDRASAAAVAALRPLEALAVPAADLLGALADAVRAADLTIAEIAASTDAGAAATTLTALLWSGSQLAQSLTDDALRGRVQGSLTVVTIGGPQIGNLLHGAAGSAFGPRPVICAGGLLTVLAVGAVVRAVPELHRYVAGTAPAPAPGTAGVRRRVP